MRGAVSSRRGGQRGVGVGAGGLSNRMKPLAHVMILASAGSGKTYALTNRFVRLLALGAPPERIVALTFTRKAAGEFFDGVLTKLAAAARAPEVAKKLRSEERRVGKERRSRGSTDR